MKSSLVKFIFFKIKIKFKKKIYFFIGVAAEKIGLKKDAQKHSIKVLFQAAKSQENINGLHYKHKNISKRKFLNSGQINQLNLLLIHNK